MSAALIPAIRRGITAEVDSLPADKKAGVQDTVNQSLSALDALLTSFEGAAFDASIWEVKQLASALSPDTGRVESLLVELTTAGEAPRTSAISFLDGAVTLSNLALTWHLLLDPDGITDTQFQLRGSIDFKGKFSADATLSIPALDGSIQLACEPRFKLSGLAELASLIGVGDITASLPAGLSGMGNLELSYLRIEMAPGFNGVRAVALAIRCEDEWSLVDGQLAIQNLRINLALQLSGSTELTGYVLGTLALGPVDVDVAVTRFNAEDDWGLAIQSRRIALPSLKDLSDLTGTNLDRLLPHPLGDCELTIFDLDIDLNLSERQIKRIDFSLAANHRISLSSALPEIDAFHVDFLLDWSSGSLSHYGAIAGALVIPGARVNLKGELADEFVLSGALSSIQLSELFAQLLAQFSLPTNLPEIKLTDIEFSMAYKRATVQDSSAWDCSIASAVSCDLSTPAKALGIRLPESVSAIKLSRLAVWRDAEDESWHLQLLSESPLPFDPENPDGVKIVSASLELIHQPKSGTHLGCTFVIDGNVDVSNEVSLQFSQLKFGWQQSKSSWSVDGDVAANIVGEKYQLVASVEVRGDGNSISLKYPAELQLSDLGGVGAISVRDLTLFTEKETDGDRVSHRWGVSGAAGIAVNHLFEANGELSVQSGTDGSRLRVSAKAPQVPPIPLLLDLPSNPELRLSLDDLTIVYAKDEKGASWSLASAANLQITNIPDLLKKYLPPEQLKGYLHADGKTVVIGFDVPSTLQPDFPELALKFSNDVKISLGKPEIAVTALELELGENPRLLQKISAGLPSQLNNIFGVDANKQPNLDLFNDSFDLQLVMAKKLGLSIATSPFKPLDFYQIDGDDGQWTKWDFGPVGKVEFRVPEFSFQDGRWSASCGFNRLTDIGLPLKPIKFLLEKSGFPAALTKSIPNALPLKDIDLTGDNFSHEMKLLLGDEVLGQLDKKASAVLNELFDAIKDVIDRLPTRLQEYLQIRVPKSAILEISVDSTGGGTSLALRTLPNDPPLKLLFPMMVAIPELMGISLRGFSFGQKMGGALALIEFDGYIDRLDMVSLVAALALGKQDISNRYILDNTLFVVPTALPLPIPLFFTNLGLDYRDILGFDIQAHWSYPDPELGLVETISLFGDLIQFFKDPNYLLHKEGFGETLGLELTIGENFISLPSYLGGQTLGLQKALPTLSVGDSVARFLDFLKTGNAGYAITAIPLQHDGVWIRIGSEDIHFGPLVIGMSWCITTDEEFVNTIIPASQQNDKLPVKFDNAVLESLPTKDDAGSYSKGFIILLMGHAAIGSIVGMRTEFGIAVTAQGGFETGFRLAGEIGNALMMQMSGSIQASENSVTVKGSTGLFWKDKPLIVTSGHITVSDTSLEVEIKIELSPYFSVEGLLIVGKQGLLMSGKAAWGHGASGPNEGIGASIQFSSDGMTITFDWQLCELDGEVRIRVPGDGGNSMFSASVMLKPNPALQESFTSDIKSVAKSTAESTVDRVYDDLQKAISGVESLEVSVAGLRKWLPPLCHEIIATINKNIDANTTGWKRPGRTPARNYARPYINRLTTLADVAKNASDKTIRPKLKAALLDIVNHNKLNIGVGVPAVRYKTKKVLGAKIPYPVYYTRRITVYSRDLMNKDQLQQLRQGIEWIDKLPDRNGVRVKTQAIYDQFPDRDKLLAEINRDINNGVENAVPRIESIGFKTSLGLLNIHDLNVNVTYQRAGKTRVVTTSLDLSDPAKTSKQLIDAIGNG